MAKSDRNGKRKTRADFQGKRVPKLGYYLIVTDTEATERLYFNGLRDSFPQEIRKMLTIKVENTKTKNLIEFCKNYQVCDPQLHRPWIVFDRDQVENFDQIIKDAESEGISVGWSNPCFEIWLSAYFNKMPGDIESKICWNRFGELYKKKTGQEYEKSDRGIYKKILKYGDEIKAINLAEKKYNDCIRNNKTKPSDMCPCTTVHRLVREIKAKAEGNK